MFTFLFKRFNEQTQTAESDHHLKRKISCGACSRQFDPSEIIHNNHQCPVCGTHIAYTGPSVFT